MEYTDSTGVAGAIVLYIGKRQVVGSDIAKGQRQVHTLHRKVDILSLGRQIK